MGKLRHKEFAQNDPVNKCQSWDFNLKTQAD